MEENVLMWIQNERSEEFDYMFFGNQLLEETDLHKIKTIRDIIFNNPNSKIIWKEKNYSQSSVIKVKSNYVLTGVLKTTDNNGRHLPFMFCLDTTESSTKNIISNNLRKIEKEIDIDLLDKLLSKVNSHKKKNTIIYGSLLFLILIILYKILK